MMMIMTLFKYSYLEMHRQAKAIVKEEQAKHDFRDRDLKNDWAGWDRDNPGQISSGAAPSRSCSY